MLFEEVLFDPVPFAFVAATTKVYAVLAANAPVAVSELAVPLADKETEGVLVTVYPVIAEPPLFASVKDSVTEVGPTTVAVGVPVVPGFVDAVSEDELDEVNESPLELVAFTV
jgi:hypothetical protein